MQVFNRLFFIDIYLCFRDDKVVRLMPPSASLDKSRWFLANNDALMKFFRHRARQKLLLSCVLLGLDPFAK